jgi:hypothetical protein
METEPYTISPDHIKDHVGYWVMIESMREYRQLDHAVFDSDEDFLDFFGLSHEYLRRAKCKFRDNYTAMGL